MFNPAKTEVSEVHESLTIQDFLDYIKENNISPDTKLLIKRYEDFYFKENIPIIKKVIENNQEDEFLGTEHLLYLDNLLLII